MAYDVVNTAFYGSLIALFGGLAVMLVFVVIGGALQGANSRLSNDWPADGGISGWLLKGASYVFVGGFGGMVITLLLSPLVT